MTKEWSAGDRLEELSLDLTLRRAIQAVAGTRDYYPVHHDERFAQANGAKGIFFNTMFLQGFVGRAIAEWFGNDAFPRRLEMAMLGSNYVGQTLIARGAITGANRSQDTNLIDAEVTLATEEGPTTDVKVTVEVPRTL